MPSMLSEVPSESVHVIEVGLSCSEVALLPHHYLIERLTYGIHRGQRNSAYH